MKVRFAQGEGLLSSLRERVDAYFQETGKSPRACFPIYLKTAILLCWLGASYGLLVFAAQTWWQAIPLAVCVGLAVAGIGFNVQHDGSHGAYSNSTLLNRLAAMVMDCIGASSYVWHFKHNIFHHSYTNFTGADEDIDGRPMARFSPHDPRRFFHRFQHFYVWFLYGFLPTKWQIYDDFRNVIAGKIGDNPFPRPRGWQLVWLLAGKAIFFGWTLVIPLMFHPVGVVLTYFFFTSFVLGVTLSVVFQLAHVVEDADFPPVTEGVTRSEQEWAVHQVRSTVDFARENRWLCWYLGGLNFQVVHHLFPRVCHVHYPALARIVESTCREMDVPYRSYQSFFGALASHWRWLRRMGLPESHGSSIELVPSGAGEEKLKKT